MKHDARFLYSLIKKRYWNNQCVLVISILIYYSASGFGGKLCNSVSLQMIDCKRVQIIQRGKKCNDDTTSIIIINVINIHTHQKKKIAVLKYMYLVHITRSVCLSVYCHF